PHRLADRLRQRGERAQSRAHQPRGAREEKTLLEKISSIITTLHVLGPPFTDLSWNDSNLSPLDGSCLAENPAVGVEASGFRIDLFELDRCYRAMMGRKCEGNMRECFTM